MTSLLKITLWIFIGLIIAVFIALQTIPYGPGTNSLAYKESATKAGLNFLKVALKTYQNDHGGKCPKDLATLKGKYILEIPIERVTGSQIIVAKLDGKGGWFFDSNNCNVTLNIDGNDSKGKPYQAW